MAGLPSFEGRIAVVTGGASGIGRELLLQLVKHGAHVAVCDIDSEKLDAAAHRAQSINKDVRVSTHVLDVTKEKAVARFAQQVARQHGSDSIHLLFNNAGVTGGTSFVAGGRDDWDRTFAVSWFGTYYCTRAFLPMLIDADQGAVVNISSVNGLWASLGSKTPHSAYASAKFAVRGFTESLIADFQANAPHLSAVLVMPGHVRSGMSSPPRTWRRALGAAFADYKPLTSKQAAAAILSAVREGDWRVVLGQDAETVDERVRSDPWSAYD